MRARNLGGKYGKVELRLQPNGTEVMIDAAGQNAGTYTLINDTVRLNFYQEEVNNSGQIQGNRIEGTANNRAKSWAFSVSR